MRAADPPPLVMPENLQRHAGPHPRVALVVFGVAFGRFGCGRMETTRTMATDLTQTISDNAAGPKRAQGDAGSVEQHSLKDVMDTDRYLASKDAAKRPDRGIRISRLIPPGTGGG